jgi:DNA-binding NarL/FixJ family response regulator
VSADRLRRVLIVDDELDMRLLLRAVLERAQGFEIVGEAVDGASAVEQARQLQPELVVLDYRMPDANGVDVARTILAENPGLPILLFSALVDENMQADAARVGIGACLSKERLFDLPARLVELAGAA